MRTVFDLNVSSSFSALADQAREPSGFSVLVNTVNWTGMPFTGEIINQLLWEEPQNCVN